MPDRRDICEKIARSKRGETTLVETVPGAGMVHDLTTMLPDYGVDWAEMEMHTAAIMSEAELVDLLNDIRLRDQVFILSGVSKPSHRLMYNLHHAFTNHGGRMVLVSFQDMPTRAYVDQVMAEAA